MGEGFTKRQSHRGHYALLLFVFYCYLNRVYDLTMCAFRYRVYIAMSPQRVEGYAGYSH